MSLIYKEDIVAETRTANGDDWNHNFHEVDDRLTANATAASNAVPRVFTASSDAAMIALAARKGDICKRTDGADPKKHYQLNDADASTLGNWVFVAIWTLPDFDALIATAINALIDGAPGALNTLKELADAINDDASFAASVTTALGAKINTSDIVNDVTHTDTNKPLSANQGKVLKDLVDALTTALASKADTSALAALQNKNEIEIHATGPDITAGIATIVTHDTSVTVNTNKAHTANCLIILTQQSGITAGAAFVGTITDGTSFVINIPASMESDVTIGWQIIKLI